MTTAARRRARFVRLSIRFMAKLLFYLLICALAVIFMSPFIWMLSTSLKRLGQVFILPIQWLPDDPQWGNYIEIFKMLPFARFMANTAVVTVLATLGDVVSAVIVGYSLARLRWAGREIVFGGLLATMMLPGVVTLVPTFILFYKLKWIDYLLSAHCSSWFGSAFYIFMLRQFMRGLPIELDEAARLDGAGSLRILFEVVVPLCRPAIAAVLIFAGMAHYNNFMGALIYLSRNEKFTIAMGLYMFRGQQLTLWHLQMAASMVAVAPLLVLFFFGQRYFVQGLTFSGLTGR